MTDAATTTTGRLISEGAEKWLFKEVPVLDHGNVMLVDYMGNDVSIELAARVSYGKGTRKQSETEGLIRYLMRHDHTTPFEMPEVKFAARMPIFVARQWVRHRTASINEYSARYSVVKDTFYIPEDEVIQLQSVANKQGRGKQADEAIREKAKSYLAMDAHAAYQHYTEMLEDGVARELARANLPVGFYTEWYWKIDLHNLMRFLRLRLDQHAQYEVRMYAEAMAKIVSEAFPIAWQAFVDYQLEATKVTRPEMQVLKSLGLTAGLYQIAAALKEEGLTNQRERLEAIEKLQRLGILRPTATANEVEAYCDVLELSPRQRSREVEGLVAIGIAVPEDE